MYLANHTIFGGIFPSAKYYPPDGFCWEYPCKDDFINDDPYSDDYNLHTKVSQI